MRAVQGLLGGSAASAIVATVGTQIGGGNSVGLTWLDAAVWSGLGFVIGVIVWALGLALLLQIFVIKPLVKRYGIGYGSRIRLALFSGHESVTDLLKRIARRHDADFVWDEFAVASLNFFAEIDGVADMATLLYEGTDDVLIDEDDAVY